MVEVVLEVVEHQVDEGFLVVELQHEVMWDELFQQRFQIQVFFNRDHLRGTRVDRRRVGVITT